MFEELKKQSKRYVFRILAGIAVIIIVFLGITSASILKLIEGPKDLDSLSIDELPGSYVKGDINIIIDDFAGYYVENDNGTEEITDNFYIVPIGEEEYIALKVSKEDFDIANQICDETYEYMLGNRDDLSTTMTVTATINKLKDDAYEYYVDWFKTSGYLENPTMEEIERIALPYMIQVDYVGKIENTALYILFAAIGVAILCAIIITIKTLTGAYVAPIKKYIKRNEDHLNSERIEVDFQNASHIENIYIGQSWTFHLISGKARIVENKDIIWAYLEEVTHRVYGIKSRVSKSLVMYTKDKGKHTVFMKSKDGVNSALSIFSQTQPHVVIGYSDELKKCFMKDFETFIRIPYMKETAATDQTSED